MKKEIKNAFVLPAVLALAFGCASRCTEDTTESSSAENQKAQKNLKTQKDREPGQKTVRITEEKTVHVKKTTVKETEKPVDKTPSPPKDTPTAKEASGKKPLVEIAVLLDTSNSMDGLISQAKSQLWEIINEFATSERKGQKPDLRVALYEYGNDSIPAGEAHIRQVLPLTNNLDKVSEELFALKTNGGSEYCGAVIDDSIRCLQWSSDPHDYKAIFIAGNEPFTQGSVNYQDACTAAREKGVVVNTIFCGNEKQGITGKWDQGAMLAGGSYMNIDQNVKVARISAPQDAEIARLNILINKTYIGYGARGSAGAMRQAEQDRNAKKIASSVMVKRAATKASRYYDNSSWDLVDAVHKRKVKLEELKEDQLPEKLRNMSEAERKAYVKNKLEERKKIQKKIQKLYSQRKKYVADEMKKRMKNSDKTLEKVIITTVRKQAKKLDFEFEK